MKDQRNQSNISQFSPISPDIAMQEKEIRRFLYDVGADSIDDILVSLGHLYNADRAYVFEDDKEKGITVNTYEWCAPGVTAQIDNLQSLPLAEIKEIENVIKNSEFVIHSLDDELDSDDPIYRILKPQQIDSLILSPLMIDGMVSGYVGVDNPRSNTQMSLVVSIAAAVICTKILSKRKLAENYESYLVLSKLRDQYSTLYYADFDTDYMHTYKTNDSYNKKYGDTSSYSRSMGYYVSHDIAEKDRERMIRMTDPAYVTERFKTEDSFVLSFVDNSFGEDRYCEFRYIKADDSASRAVICGIDLTNVKKASEEAISALNEMKDIISAADMGTWRIELIEGKAPRLIGDDRMIELLGLNGKTMTPEEVYDSWFSNITPQAVQSVLDSVAKMESGVRDENTYLWHHPLLNDRYVRCGGTAQAVPGGYILRGYHYDVDNIVREQMKQAELLKNALNAAEHANRAKTTFLNNMSHDIRTPMNAIIGYTALAASHIDNKEQVKDYLSKITVSSSHLLSLINDVLDMSRIESGKVTITEQDVHLPDILHDIRTITQANVNSKQLDFFIDTVDVVHEDIICDKLRLDQILLNILNNATKFTKPGGAVSVRVVEKPCKLSGYAHYEFHIKDTGIGMSEEFQQHIFEPFTREQTSTVSGIQGTGLGMAITKNIVDMMNGTIEVKSREGVGSEFTVCVDFAISNKQTKYQPLTQLQNIRALVADDDSDTAVSVSNMLKSIGLRSDWTLSGKEAVLRTKVAVDEGDEYGVYIIDWLMPDMNGIETVRQIRRYTGEQAAIIILTAYDWADIEDEARAAGVTGFISKPIFMSELRDILSKPYSEGTDMNVPAGVDNRFKGKRILLVEDNKLNQEIALALLTDHGFSVESAEDGDKAVELVLGSSPDRFDLILMDIQMPTMNGYDATKAIRQASDSPVSSIPIIAMSANAFEEDKTLAKEAGMNGYITKPIDIKKIFSEIEKYF